jgi:DNA-binding NarL/FixJ family response regulator
MVQDPALVLLSVQESGSDSLTAIGTLKARWPAVRCIVLVDTVAQQQAACAAGADEALIKGVRPDKLLRRVEALLGEKERALPCGHGSEA